jgi:integrase
VSKFKFKTVSEAKQELDRRGASVAIREKGNWLYLRFTAEPMPGSKQQKRCQHDIATGYSNTPAGVQQAFKDALVIDAKLASKTFSWTDDWDEVAYVRRQEPKAEVPKLRLMTHREAIEAFEADYFNRRARTPESETTWRTSYMGVFRKLPPNELLTRESLLHIIESTKPDTKTRLTICMAYGALLKLIGIEGSFAHLRGNYSPRRVQPRDIPPDELIVQCYYQIAPKWRWSYGAIATYGLRPHELWHADTSDLERGGITLRIIGGKTGTKKPRDVWPFHPEWVDEFNLRNVNIPTLNRKNNSNLGQAVGDAFRKAGVPFAPYFLRHAWAVRTIGYGLSRTLAAKQMGHTQKVHEETYLLFIPRDVHQKAFEDALNNPNRPKPPVIQFP